MSITEEMYEGLEDQWSDYCSPDSILTRIQSSLSHISIGMENTDEQDDDQGVRTTS